MKRRLRLRRGQATVELAVTTIVFVPLCLYVLFLDDLLRYKLDLAEAVFSSSWDYTSIPYDKGAPDLSSADEFTYCDHTSAYDSYTQQDCDAIARQLNHRPRKRLGYRTPEECYAR